MGQMGGEEEEGGERGEGGREGGREGGECCARCDATAVEHFDSEDDAALRVAA